MLNPMTLRYDICVGSTREQLSEVAKQAIVMLGEFPKDADELRFVKSINVSEIDLYVGIVDSENFAELEVLLGFAAIVRELNIPQIYFLERRVSTDYMGLVRTLVSSDEGHPYDLVVGTYTSQIQLLTQLVVGINKTLQQLKDKESITPTYIRKTVDEYMELQTLLDSDRARRLSLDTVFGLPSRERQLECDVFMVMPFRDEFNRLYIEHIKPAVQALNFEIKRGDDPFSKHDIMHEIWSLIYNCRLVIAECTDRNANVLYELGIAHALGKPAIMIARDIRDIPFDLQGKRTIVYETTHIGIDKLKDRLGEAIASILNKGNNISF